MDEILQSLGLRLDDIANPRVEFRTDRLSVLEELPPPRLGPAGSRIFNGIAARSCVLEYDGGRRRELVTEDCLRGSDAALSRAPVTLRHPAQGEVTPETSSELTVGDVGHAYTADGCQYVGEVTIRRADALANLDAGEVGELSVGYRVVLDETPGVDPVHGAYDAIQIARVPNHLALVPRGRAGATARLRTDSTDHGDSMLPKLLALLAAAHVRTDGATPETEEAALAAVETLIADRDAATARADAATARADALEAAEKARKDAAERSSLVALAKSLKLDVADDATLAGLKRTIAKTALPALREDASDAYIDAAVDIVRGRVDSGNEAARLDGAARKAPDGITYPKHLGGDA